jgi:hypothetical protein
MDSQEIENKIKMIQRQTDYDENTAKDKLILFNNDVVLVIKNYLGISEKKENINSINQEIYKQMRLKFMHQSNEPINKL